MTIDLFRARGHGNAAEGDSYLGIENGVGTLFADTLIGDDGANGLAGGRGADTLIGLGGADRFVFDTLLEPGNVDNITDFTVADDTIQLGRGIFTEIAAGTLSADAFTTGAVATSAAHRILYDQTTGQIFYDADGTGAGAAVLFATVTAGTALTAADFVAV